MMKLQIHAGQRNNALAEFEKRGPNRTPGVKFRGAWVATQEDAVFALVESADEPAVQQAYQAWSEFGEWSVCPVVNIENY